MHMSSSVFNNLVNGVGVKDEPGLSACAAKAPAKVFNWDLLQFTFYSRDENCVILHSLLNALHPDKGHETCKRKTSYIVRRVLYGVDVANSDCVATSPPIHVFFDVGLDMTRVGSVRCATVPTTEKMGKVTGFIGSIGTALRFMRVLNRIKNNTMLKDYKLNDEEYARAVTEFAEACKPKEGQLLVGDQIDAHRDKPIFTVRSGIDRVYKEELKEENRLKFERNWAKAGQSPDDHVDEGAQVQALPQAPPSSLEQNVPLPASDNAGADEQNMNDAIDVCGQGVNLLDMSSDQIEEDVYESAESLLELQNDEGGVGRDAPLMLASSSSSSSKRARDFNGNLAADDESIEVNPIQTSADVLQFLTACDDEIARVHTVLDSTRMLMQQLHTLVDVNRDGIDSTSIYTEVLKLTKLLEAEANFKVPTNNAQKRAKKQ